MPEPAGWVVFVPDPWTWQGWMFDRLRDVGCRLVMGPSADDPTATPLNDDGMARALAGVDGVLLHSRESIRAVALAAAPRLRVIAKMGIGVERIDVAAATASGVVVTNTPVPENYQGIAEGTVALLLALLKRLPEKERQLRDGRWRDRHSEGELLLGRTVGLIGLGRVGSTVAKLLGGWRVQLLATDPAVDAARAREVGAELVSIETLLRESSVISIHAARPSGAPPVLGERELSLVAPGSYLINTARGNLVDEPALVDALRDGRLAGAALDVFATEPLPAHHVLRELPNVILTPHSIGTSRASQHAICAAAVDCCLSALAGEVPEYVVNREVLPAWRERLARLDAEAATSARVPSTR